MNKEKYNELKEQIELTYQNNLRNLAKDYALANNPNIKVGDTVEDHIGKVLVEKITFSMGGFGYMPCLNFFGIELKKDGTPRKDGSKRTVVQVNLKL